MAINSVSTCYQIQMFHKFLMPLVSAKVAVYLNVYVRWQIKVPFSLKLTKKCIFKSAHKLSGNLLSPGDPVGGKPKKTRGDVVRQQVHKSKAAPSSEQSGRPGRDWPRARVGGRGLPAPSQWMLLVKRFTVFTGQDNCIRALSCTNWDCF